MATNETVRNLVEMVINKKRVQLGKLTGMEQAKMHKLINWIHEGGYWIEVSDMWWMARTYNGYRIRYQPDIGELVAEKVR